MLRRSTSNFGIKNPHLFVRETIAIRNLRINAIITGFDKTYELFKAKLEQMYRVIFDERCDLGSSSPDYDDDEISEKDPPDGWAYCTDDSKKNFLRYNIKFWLEIYKYHPLFYHHRCIGWAGANNPTKISMCPMAKSNEAWRARHDIGFIDSTLTLNAISINEFKPLVCHCKKNDTVITCSRLEQHLKENSSKCVFHGGLSEMSLFCKDNFHQYLNSKIFKDDQLTVSIIPCQPRLTNNPTIRSLFALSPATSTKSCSTEPTTSIVTINTSPPVPLNLEKPVQTVDLTHRSDVSMMSCDIIAGKAKPSKNRDNSDGVIPRKSIVHTNPSTKRKSESPVHISNKMTRSHANKSNNGTHSGSNNGCRQSQNRFDPRHSRNHREGRLSYRETRDQHLSDNYDKEAAQGNGLLAPKKSGWSRNESAVGTVVGVRRKLH